MFDKKDQGRWWDFGWQLIEGCTKISPACKNCWSLEKEKRFGIPKEVIFHPERLDRPLKRKKPASYAIWNDLFHEDVSDGNITSTLEVIQKCPQHIFILLTKRPERALKYFTRLSNVMKNGVCNINFLPFNNIWLGVTAENQETANKRIPILLEIPAVKRFVSIEPCLSSINLYRWLNYSNLDENKNHHETQRDIIYEPDCNGGFQDKRRGDDLENEANDGRGQNRNTINANKPKTSNESGKIDITKTSEGDVHHEQKKVFNLCAQSGMDVSKSTGNSRWVRDKSQRWESKKQQARQSGGGNEEREHYTRSKNTEGDGEKRTERRKEQLCEVDGNEHINYKEDLGQETNVANINSETLQGIPGNNKCNLFKKNMEAHLNWVICGGESGHNARPMHPDWVRSIRDQCKDGNAPFFFKQWGEWLMTGGNQSFSFLPSEKTKRGTILTTSELEPKRDKIGYVGMLRCDVGTWFKKVGKSKSGSEIDGQHHKEFPI